MTPLEEIWCTVAEEWIASEGYGHLVGLPTATGKILEYVFCPGTLCGWRYLAQSSLPCPPGKKIGRIKLSGTVSLSRTHRFALLGLIWCAQIGSHSTATALVMAGVRRASTSGASRTIHSAPVAASRRCPTLSTSVR